MSHQDDKWGNLNPPNRNENIPLSSLNEQSNKPQNVDEIHIDPGTVTKPLVLLVGPRESGKTIVLLRLAHFLSKKKGYKLNVNESFRSDNDYEEVVKRFENNLVDIQNSPGRTGNINFLLLDVFKGNNPYCHILESPGEAFFDLRDPTKKSFNNYIHTIFNNVNNKKIVVFFFENGMLGNPAMRAHYSNRLQHFLSLLDFSKDKIIILYNKVDTSPELFVNSEVNKQALKEQVFNGNTYAEFEKGLRSNNALKKIHFVPFSSGAFFKSGTKETWSIGNDKYPQTFWNAIQDSVKPKKWGWF